MNACERVRLRTCACVRVLVCTSVFECAYELMRVCESACVRACVCVCACL